MERPLEDLVRILPGLAVRPMPVGSDQPADALLSLRLAMDPLPSRDQLDHVRAKPEHDRYALATDDIVLAARGAFRAVVTPPSHEGVILGANLIALRPKGPLSARVLAAYLLLPATQAQLFADTRGAATRGFTMQALRRLRLRLPPSATIDNLDAALLQARIHREESRQAIDAYARALDALVARACTP